MATRKKRRKRRQSFPIAFVATFAILLGLMALAAYLPQFRLKHVAVYGQTSLIADDILPLVQPVGDPFFVIGIGPELEHWLGLRYGDLETDLLRQFPILDRVLVRFEFPSTLRVEVIDKPEVVSARVPEGYALLDSKANVISLREAPSAFLPVTEGLQLAGSVFVGERLPVDEEQFQAALRSTAAMIAADETLGYENKLMTLTRQVTILEGQIRLDLMLTGGQRWRVTVEDNSMLVKNMATLSELIEQGLLQDKGSGEMVLGADEIVFTADEP